MGLGDIVVLLIVVMAGAFVWRTIAVREYALLAVKKHLSRLELQLLEDAVAFSGLGWSNGRLLRVFQFEFASLGDQRYSGKISLCGLRVDSIRLEPYRIPNPPHQPLH